MIKQLTADTPLTSAITEPDQQLKFSVLSYNILLPNHEDGWWIFKSYDNNVPMAQRQWSHRKALLHEQLLSAQADIICLQEASEPTFEEDFAALREAGYDCVLHKKYRFRNATFWHRERFTLTSEHHKDRTLVTTLRHNTSGRHVHIVNAHLSGGPAPERRFRQAFDALDQCRKDANKLGLATEDAATILCGDLNSYPGDTALEHLLQGQTLTPEYREPYYPDTPITSKHRAQPFGPFTDVYLSAYGDESQRPSTFVNTFLVDRYFPPSSTPGTLTPEFSAALTAMFDRFAQGKPHMTRADIDDWVTTINLAPERGSEHRMAIERLNNSPTHTLTLPDFTALYLDLLNERKFRPVYHDLQVCGHELPAGPKPLYAVCLDRIYSSPALTPLATRAPLTPEQHTRVYTQHESLPNAWHPSDHLPLAAIFQWKP